MVQPRFAERGQKRRGNALKRAAVSYSIRSPSRAALYSVKYEYFGVSHRFSLIRAVNSKDFVSVFW